MRCVHLLQKHIIKGCHLGFRKRPEQYLIRLHPPRQSHSQLHVVARVKCSFCAFSPADKLSLSLEREYPSPSPNTVRYIGGITPLPFTHTKAYHSRQVMGLAPDRDTKEAEEAPPPARRQPVFQSFCSGGTPAAVNYDPGGVGEEEHCARGVRRQEEARRRRRERQQNQAVMMQILLTLSFSKLPFQNYGRVISY